MEKSNDGGHRYTLSDEIRLKDCMLTLIKRFYNDGASTVDIEQEDIRMELDNYSGQFEVANRRKQHALKELVKENRLIAVK